MFAKRSIEGTKSKAAFKTAISFIKISDFFKMKEHYQYYATKVKSGNLFSELV